MMDKAVRFKVVFNEPDPEREPVESAVAGRSAVVEMTAEQVATIAAIMDELEATAHAWNLRLNTSDDNVVPDEALLVDAELEIALPFVIGDKERPFDEDRPGIADWEPVGDDAPFENPQTGRWVSIDAGWMRAFLSVGGVLAPLPLEELQRHFGLGATTTDDKPVTREAFDRLVDLHGQLGKERNALEAQVAGLRHDLNEAAWRESVDSLLIDHLADEKASFNRLMLSAEAEVRRLTADLAAVRGESVDGTLPEPGEPVRIFLNAERGPKGDRWLVEPVGGGLPSIVKDELVAGWQRRPSAEAKP